MIVSTPEDIGRQTGAIVLDPKLANQAVFTAGDTATSSQLADTVYRLLTRTVEDLIARNFYDWVLIASVTGCTVQCSRVSIRTYKAHL
ncbi:hypothetical protein IMF27_27400 [Pseudomonas sp. PCH199]|uniref:hypothetical protein n=1 Tax=unclassified Pseudomonas TaxID=196821 RepID=UPI000BC3B304|nr:MULTISPECIES: hypothetical protein [unclassified Pseudomonas]MCW8278789.1 hypothetical protein [Pseudomonas sp. PCH199]PAM81004.1 hypothetical protein CES87_28025 [Pseudomonas sp. ERMR1:02]